MLQLARSITANLSHHWKHVSFILDGGHVVSAGWNQPFKTHPMAARFKYRYNAIHSELHSIISFSGTIAELKRLTLVNIRINAGGGAAIAAPCETCRMLLGAFCFKEVWYTDRNGSFQKFLP